MSLPRWTAGIAIGRAAAGISTGETDFDQLDTALKAVAAERNRDRVREQDEEPQR